MQSEADPPAGPPAPEAHAPAEAAPAAAVPLAVDAPLAVAVAVDPLAVDVAVPVAPAFPEPSAAPSPFAALAGASATGTLASAADEPRRSLPLPDHPPDVRRPAPMSFLVIVTLVSLAADLVTKYFAKSRLSGYDAKAHAAHRFEVWKNHADFIFAQNPGGAWSFLRGLPDSLRRPFFLVVSAAAIVFIVSIYRRVSDDQRAMKWGLPLALGGAMGNLVDRIRYGWVVDFVDVYVSRAGHEHHWPTFNVADIAIVLGVGLMAIDMLWTRGSRRVHAPEARSATAP
jgi:signal peptidase II